MEWCYADSAFNCRLFSLLQRFSAFQIECTTGTAEKVIEHSRRPGDECATWNNASSNWLPTRRFNRGMEARQTSMRPIIFWSFPLLIFLSGCHGKPECDSFETRNAVLHTVSDDHNNALGKFAAKHSAMTKRSDASQEAENSKQPLYVLGEKIVTTSTSKDKRTLKCSGSISVTVGNTKASKEVNFTVQQSSDGKISVSVAPFEF